MSDEPFGTTAGNGAEEEENPVPVTGDSAVTDRLDAVFDLLQDARRRYLLYYFDTVDAEVVELAAAVEAVQRYETDGTTAGGQSLPLALHHVHLPRLSDAGVLDYDDRQGTIRLTGHGWLAEWVEHTRTEELG